MMMMMTEQRKQMAPFPLSIDLENTIVNINLTSLTTDPQRNVTEREAGAPYHRPAIDTGAIAAERRDHVIITIAGNTGTTIDDYCLIIIHLYTVLFLIYLSLICNKIYSNTERRVTGTPDTRRKMFSSGFMV